MTNKRGAAATSAENCALITDSILVCMQGGIIKFVTSGQMMAATDLLALLETLLFLMAKQMNALQKQKIASQGEAYVKKPAYTGGDDFISPEAEAKMREELKRDIETLRQIAAKIDKTWDNVTLTDEEIRENYEHNLKQTLKSVAGATSLSTGHIISQKKITNFKYGTDKTVDYNGCGPIATYNALVSLGENPDLADILHYYEENEGTLLGGAFGTNPSSIMSYFAKDDYSVYSSVSKNGIKKNAEKADANIIFFLGTDVSGNTYGHYVEAIPVGDGKFHFYNADDGNDADIRTMDDFFSTYKGIQTCISITDTKKGWQWKDWRA